MTQGDEAERQDAPEPASKPRKKRKKKRSKAVEPAATSSRSELDAQGRERPRFLLEFPSDPELDRLARAFESGDFATVRSDAEALADKSEDPLVRDAALELRRRIDPDPLIKYILLASVLLLGFLVLYVYSHRH
jgi:hypothetical protein